MADPLKPTVVVIDDDSLARASLCKEIESLGFRCRPSDNSVEIEKNLAKVPSPILILDASFLREAPADDGTLCVKSHGIETLADKLPWLVIASQPTIDEALAAVKGGAQDYLPKPVDLDRLRIALQKCCQEYPKSKGNAVIQKFAEVCQMSTNGSGEHAESTGVEVDSVIDLKKTSLMDDIERQAILFTLTQTGGNVGEAARVLGLGPATVYRKIKRYGIRAKHFASMSHSV